MNAVDYVLLVLAVLAGLAGWRNGLVGGVLSFAGFIGGALVGALLAPHLVAALGLSGIPGAALGIGVIVLAAGIGNAIAGLAGSWIRAAVTWRPARFVDSVGGVVFGVLSLALVAWVVASALLVVPLGAVSAEVRGSRVLGGIDAVMPQAPRDWLSGLRSALDSTGFTQAFGGFTLDPVIPVQAPDPAVLKDPEVRAALASLVKVEGVAPDCGTQVDGSGFVYAKDRVMTNAHVVAGVANPVVLVGGTGRAWRARVVYLDPRVDVAVLEVPGLSAPALAFSTSAEGGDPAVVAGFPGGGALTVGAARVRARISARGTDIYGNGVVIRDIYSVRGTVRPGNSGGPLLSPAGRVYGVVFASSVDDPDTGYALTADEVADGGADRRRGRHAGRHRLLRHALSPVRGGLRRPTTGRGSRGVAGQEVVADRASVCWATKRSMTAWSAAVTGVDWFVQTIVRYWPFCCTVDVEFSRNALPVAGVAATVMLPRYPEMPAGRPDMAAEDTRFWTRAVPSEVSFTCWQACVRAVNSARAAAAWAAVP